MSATRGAAFPTAVGVIDRVLRSASRERTLAEPAVASGRAHVGVLVVGVRHRTHRTHALAANVALFARTETHDDETAVTTDDLRISAGRTGDLATLARLHLDIVDDRADRHLRQFHRIARLHVGLLAGDDGVAHGQTQIGRAHV